MRPESHKYTPRLADGWVRESLQTAGAVLIEGPKACGKTATARELAASEVLLDVDDEMRAAAELDPGLVIAGETPRLIDEWQVEPKIWNHVRRAVDDRRIPGQFILAGSAVPNDDDTRHSGAGRIMRVRMRPMSLYESGDSSGEISLAAVMKGENVGAGRPIENLEDVTGLVARGGWPALISYSAEDAGVRVLSYLDEVRRTDIRRVDGVARDPERVGRMIRSLARNIATDVAFTTLAADTGGSEGPLDEQTVSEYIGALERIFVVEQQPAWAPHMRSKYVLRRTPRSRR